MLGPQGCECPEAHHSKHRGGVCGAIENLFPIGRENSDGKMVVHWACGYCYRLVCNASPGRTDFVPLGNLAA